MMSTAYTNVLGLIVVVLVEGAYLSIRGIPVLTGCLIQLRVFCNFIYLVLFSAPGIQLLTNSNSMNHLA